MPKEKNSPRLQGNFEASWLIDFEIMREIGERAFLLCLFLRLKCDPHSRLCRISELDIQKYLGWDPKNTRRHLKKLVNEGYIVPKGYLLYFVRTWRRLSTDSGEKPELKKISPRAKSPTTSGKKPVLPRAKSPTTSGKKPELINTESDIQIQNTAVLSLVGKDFKSKDENDPLRKDPREQSR